MYSLETRCIHGEAHSVQDANYAVSFPIYQTACFSHLTPGHNPTGFDYSRESNPTRKFLEERREAMAQKASMMQQMQGGMGNLPSSPNMMRPEEETEEPDLKTPGEIRDDLNMATAGL